MSHVLLYTTVLVFLHSDQLQSKKYKSIKEEKFKVQNRYQLQLTNISQSKKKNSKYKTGIDYSEENNKLFKVQKKCVVLKFTQVKFP